MAIEKEDSLVILFEGLSAQNHEMTRQEALAVWKRD
jgi:hypothetical protein